MFDMWTSLKWVMFQITFGILIHCLIQRPSYVLRCTHPFSTFIKSFSYFDSSFLQVFGHLFGPRSIDNPKGHLGHKQTFFLIIFSGIKLISTSSIAPVIYLKSWALVASIIVVRFIVDQHPSFLKPLHESTITPSLSNNISRWHVISYHH
jgi:hypothetical protein